MLSQASFAGASIKGATGLTGATGPTTFTLQTLTDAATINWDISLGPVAQVILGGNRTIAAPTNLNSAGTGTTYILKVIQDGSGNRTLIWNSVFKWPSAVAPVLSTSANSVDVFSFFSDGTNLYGSYIRNVS